MSESIDGTNGAPAVQEPKFVKGERLFNYQLGQWMLVARTARPASSAVALQRDGYAVYRDRVEFFPTYRRQDRRGVKRMTGPDAEQKENRLLSRAVPDSPEEPRLPTHGEITGPKIKHYVVTYLEQTGAVGVERVAAKGMVTAISIFYVMRPGTAVISVVCIL